MLFQPVNPDLPVPIWEQIVAQVTYAIASGALESGELIPSVRELAPRILVHPNTVAKAYQELERRGVVVSRRGKGMEVTPGAPELCRTWRRDLIRRRVRETLREAVASALSPEEVRQIVEEELDRADGQRRLRDSTREKR
ncbi:MAG TPA: GntR family transcriptional regulator [Gemmataceae bacterium]|nr:GntR family transcriptional regulator [Gemmataceae bacterium]